ncbi:MAG TPA: HEAT repeat domain-containing protein [Gemmatimonadales bacterium]|nr:HEAT repeat domain-containing protein [Gemmatimonadales bacterium]
MSPRSRVLGALLAVLATGLVASLGAQSSLRNRVEGSGDARVQFRYAARADVCGLGSSIQVGTSTYINTGNSNLWNGVDRPACRRGPVVVRVTRAGGMVVGVDTEIAPVSSPEGVTDLGVVSAAAAADYLLDLAARAEGRPGREAILPAMLADSATVWPKLIEIARNGALSRSVRQGAMSWLGRELDRSSGDEARQASAALVAIATNTDEMTPIRQQAVSVLARSERADLAALTRMAGGTDTWLRQAAIQALASSGDPRAREFLRTAFLDPALPEALRTSVIRGLGREYATGKDIELLRSRYPSLTSAASKQAVLSVLAEQGGAANQQWLLGVATDADATPELRAHAIEAVQKAGATAAQLGRLYEQAPDRRSKEAAINGLFRNGDRQSVDRLLLIAKNETDVSVRRSVISKLGRLEDPRVQEFLKELVGQP